MNIKKLMLFMLLFHVAFCGFSQTDDVSKVASTKVKTNEIRLNMSDLLLLHTIGATYEYTEHSELGAGLTARLNLSENNGGIIDEKYSITPFVRYYLIKKQDYGSKGFYVETFLKLFGGNYNNNGWYDTRQNTYWEIALGIGLGYKYVSSSGFIVDLNLGLGRSLGVSDWNSSDAIVGRGGVLFGFCF